MPSHEYILLYVLFEAFQGTSSIRKMIEKNLHKRYELTTRATNGCTATSLCSTHCSGIQGTFVPIGRVTTGTATERMVYARTELVSNTQYYFYQQDNGAWEFTWDQWLTLSDIDIDNFGDCKIFERFSA